MCTNTSSSEELESTEKAAKNASSSSARRKGKPRVTIEERVMEKLQQKAEQAAVPPSKLANFVLDTYLGEIEKALFGRTGIRDLEHIDKKLRLIDAVFISEGALCDTKTISRVAASEFFAESYGLQLSLSDFDGCDGLMDHAMLETIARQHGGLDDFDGEKAYRSYSDLFVRKYATSERLFPYRGSRSLIERVQQLGLSTVVRSRSSKSKLEATLKAIDLPSSLFNRVLSVDTQEERSVSIAEVLTLTAQELGFEAHRCVSIDDELNGVLAAREAGLRSIAVATSVSSQSEFEADAHVVREETALVTLIDIFGAPPYDEPDHLVIEKFEQEPLEAKKDEPSPSSTAADVEPLNFDESAGKEAAGTAVLQVGGAKSAATDKLEESDELHTKDDPSRGTLDAAVFSDEPAERNTQESKDCDASLTNSSMQD